LRREWSAVCCCICGQTQCDRGQVAIAHRSKLRANHDAGTTAEAGAPYNCLTAAAAARGSPLLVQQEHRAPTCPAAASGCRVRWLLCHAPQQLVTAATRVVCVMQPTAVTCGRGPLGTVQEFCNVLRSKSDKNACYEGP
jgi:hypothetical protein